MRRFIPLLLVLATAPFILPTWGIAQLGFVATYIVAGTGLMLLAGYAGQLSLCHAAFIGVGAYTEAILNTQGWPFVLSMPAAGLFAAGVGLLAAWPARRLSGIAFAIATLSFGFIVQEVLTRWEALTGGNAGLSIPALDPATLFWLAGSLALTALWLLGRVLDSSSGRAWVALREDSTAAAVLGASSPAMKVQALLLAAALGGIAGALYAHQLRFVSPEQFDWVMSIELLMMLVIGGLGTRTGIVLGALFLIALPQAIGLLRDAWPAALPPAGLELFAFGLVLVLSLRFAPAGLAGWLRSL